MARRHVIAAVAMGLAVPVFGQQIYKWVDDRGVTQYTMTPPPGGKAQAIKVQPGNSKPAAGAKSWQEQEAEFRTRQVERAEAQRKQEQADRGTALRDLQMLEQQQRIYTFDEKGERQYMDDAQRAEIARKTKAFLEQECSR